jgi:hypothetical protein
MIIPVSPVSRRLSTRREPSDVTPVRFPRMARFAADPGMAAVNNAPAGTNPSRALRGCYAPTAALPGRFRMS